MLNMFTTPPTKPVYYEDLYRKPNPDEEFDRFLDVCEEESSNSEEGGKPNLTSLRSPQEGFFTRFQIPKRKERAGGSEVGSARFGESKRKKGE
jgi:hypothetical protein